MMKKFVIPAVMAALAGAAAIFAKSKNKAIDVKKVNGKIEDGVVKGYKKSKIMLSEDIKKLRTALSARIKPLRINL